MLKMEDLTLKNFNKFSTEHFCVLIPLDTLKYVLLKNNTYIFHVEVLMFENELQTLLKPTQGK